MLQARGRLAWLDISLPQRGAEGLTTIIPAVFQLLTNKEVTLPAFSITGALPSLMNGGKDFSEWSPKDLMNLNVMKRYQYFTQAMPELTEGRYDAALLTLAPFEEYVRNCARHIDSIHLNVLTAIALYRKKDERWRERLTVALDAAAEYRFIRTVSVYGTAVLPLLEALDWDGNKAWCKRLMAAVRTQAAFYPHFLETRLAPPVRS